MGSHDLACPDSFSISSLHRHGSSLKPNGSQSLEEDEGFSDWTQRRERRRQQRLQELSQGGYEDEYEEEDTIKKAVPIKSTKASITSLQLQRQEQEDRDRVEMERRKEHEEEMIRAERARREKEREEELRKKDELISRRSEESQRPHPEVGLPYWKTEFSVELS